jgi:hypothetical protein
MLSLSIKVNAALLCVILLTNISQAQINIKSKLEKKADEAIDDLLFGKKKSGSSGSSTSSETYSSPDVYTDEESTESNPLGNYSRESVNYSSLSASQIVNFRDLINFLPDKMGGYSLSEKPEGATTRYGELTYSTGGKNYSDGKKEMSASIFDYLKVGAMLSGYTNQYETESSDGIMKSIEVKGQPGWFTANYESGETNMMLIVNDRFLLMLTGSNLTEATLKGFMQSMDIDQLPKAVVTTEE